MSSNGRYNPELERKIERLLTTGKPTGEPLLDDLARSVPTANPEFQKQLEDELMSRLYEVQAPMNIMPYPTKPKSHLISVAGWMAAALALVMIGVVFAANAPRSTQGSAVLQTTDTPEVVLPSQTPIPVVTATPLLPTLVTIPTTDPTEVFTLPFGSRLVSIDVSTNTSLRLGFDNDPFMQSLQPGDWVDVVIALNFTELDEEFSGLVPTMIPPEFEGEIQTIVQRTLRNAMVAVLPNETEPFLSLAVSSSDASVMVWYIDSNIPMILVPAFEPPLIVSPTAIALDLPTLTPQIPPATCQITLTNPDGTTLYIAPSDFAAEAGIIAADTLVFIRRQRRTGEVWWYNIIQIEDNSVKLDGWVPVAQIELPDEAVGCEFFIERRPTILPESTESVTPLASGQFSCQVISDGLILRSLPDQTAPEVATATQDSVLQIMEQTNDGEEHLWYRARIVSPDDSGVEGWIYTESISAFVSVCRTLFDLPLPASAQTLTPPPACSVNVNILGGLLLYAEPSLDSQELWRIPESTDFYAFITLDQTRDSMGRAWYFVRTTLDGVEVEGWVHADPELNLNNVFCLPAPNASPTIIPPSVQNVTATPVALCQLVAVNPNGVFLRSRPSLDSSRLGVVPHLTELSVTQQARDNAGRIWYYVRAILDDAEVIGWVREDDTTPLLGVCPPVPGDPPTVTPIPEATDEVLSPGVCQLTANNPAGAALMSRARSTSLPLGRSVPYATELSMIDLKRASDGSVWYYIRAITNGEYVEGWVSADDTAAVEGSVCPPAPTRLAFPQSTWVPPVGLCVLIGSNPDEQFVFLYSVPAMDAPHLSGIDQLSNLRVSEQMEDSDGVLWYKVTSGMRFLVESEGWIPAEDTLPVAGLPCPPVSSTAHVFPEPTILCTVKAAFADTASLLPGPNAIFLDRRQFATTATLRVIGQFRDDSGALWYYGETGQYHHWGERLGWVLAGETTSFDGSVCPEI